MKRILLSVFAAAITAAWVVPAGAADVTFGGQYRLRGEFRTNADFDETIQDSRAFWAQRVRLTTNVKATDDTSVKITLQDTRVFGSDDVVGTTSGISPLITDTGFNKLDAHEAYLNVENIFGAPVSFRAGRQELAYGDERLVGSFGWSNNGRAFDAFKLVYATDAVSVDVFTATISEGTGVTVAEGTGATTLSGNNEDAHLHGVYATLKQIIPNNSLDVYALAKTDGSVSNIYTLGARLKGAVAGLDYTLELPYQTGEISDTVDHSAYAFAAKVGYTLPTASPIRIGAEYDFATGDDPDTTTEVEAFDNLFPTNHLHFGNADVPGANQWSNIHAWNVNAKADVLTNLSIYGAYWRYSKDEVPVGESDEIGSEIDLVASYKYNNAVSIEAGVSRFFVGDGLVAPPAKQDDQDWAYLMFTANF